MRYGIAFVLALLVAAPAVAFDRIDPIGSGGSFTICNDQDAAGICDEGGGSDSVDNVILVQGFNHFTIFVSGTFTNCQTYAIAAGENTSGDDVSAFGKAVGGAITSSANNPLVLNMQATLLYLNCTGSVSNLNAYVEATR